MLECVAEWLPVWQVRFAKDTAHAAYLSIRHLCCLHLLPVVSLAQVICDLLKPMSLQSRVTEVKQTAFPIWSIKGRGIRKGQSTCWAPSHMSRAPSSKWLPHLPRELTSLVQGREASSWEDRKGGAQERPQTQPVVSLQPSQSLCPSSHTHHPGMLRVTVLPPHAPTSPTTDCSGPPCCQHCRPQRGKGRLRALLGSERNIL